jgi:flagellar hook-associated protein 3 FlgL
MQCIQLYSPQYSGHGMVHVSTLSRFDIPRRAVLDLQKQLAKAETEVSTGQHADPIGDLGALAGLGQSLQAQSTTLNNIQSSNAIVLNKMTAAQNALTSIQSDAQSFLKTLVGAQNTGDVVTLQQQAMSFLNSFTNTLNTTTNSAYVFAGTKTSVKPMLDYSASAQAATENAFLTAFGATNAMAITPDDMRTFLTGTAITPGLYADLFSDPAWGTNWSKASDNPTSALVNDPTSEWTLKPVTTSVSANDDAFRNLASAYTSIADLGIDGLNSATQQTVLSYAVSQLSLAIAGVTNLQTTLGISEARINNANTQLQNRASFVDKWAAQLVGVDSYTATEKLTNISTQLEVAYSLTNRISKLSLVNYLT